jgi:hypothetical protein
MPTVNNRGLFLGLGLGRLKPKEGQWLALIFPAADKRSTNSSPVRRVSLRR